MQMVWFFFNEEWIVNYWESNKLTHKPHDATLSNPVRPNTTKGKRDIKSVLTRQKRATKSTSSGVVMKPNPSDSLLRCSTTDL